jgi:hypothetical protein
MVESARRTNPPYQPTNGMAGEDNAQSPVSAEPFFIPVPSDSLDLHASPTRNPVARNRKQGGGFPVAVAMACVASCLLLGGWIAFQKSTTKPASVNAPPFQDAATKTEVVNAKDEQSAISLVEFDSLFGRETEENEFGWLMVPQLMQQETKPGSRAQMKRIEKRDLERKNKWKEIRGKRVTWRGSVDLVTTINGMRAVCVGASGGSKLQIAIQLRSDCVLENLRTGDQVTYNGVLDSIVNLGLGVHLNITDGTIIDFHRQ